MNTFHASFAFLESDAVSDFCCCIQLFFLLSIFFNNIDFVIFCCSSFFFRVNIFSYCWPTFSNFMLFTQTFPEQKPPSSVVGTNKSKSTKLNYQGRFPSIFMISWVFVQPLRVVLSTIVLLWAVLTHNRQKYTHVVWPYARGHGAFMEHPIQLELVLWWPSLHMASCSQHLPEKRRRLPVALKTHKVSQTWMWHQRAPALQSALSFLSIP